MSVVVDIEPLKDAIRQRAAQLADDAVQAMFLDMEANGPRSDEDHEHMTSMLEVTESEDGDMLITRTVRSPAEYSSYVDEGTPPHRIEGNPLLAFTARDGSRVIVRYVNHPGTERTGWWTDTLAKWSEYVAQAATS